MRVRVRYVVLVGVLSGVCGGFIGGWLTAWYMNRRIDRMFKDARTVYLKLEEMGLIPPK
jgi:membrane associated rhomboid family serine protease